MGVTGLWTILEPAGKPIALESLEKKILAIDVSIWLNQAVKGFRDNTGNAVHNAHLLGLFHRICKLLFYRIKPVFVFDGKAPQLKRETLARRRQKKSKASKQARHASAKILDNYVRSQVVAKQLQRQTFAINKVLEKGQEGLQNILGNRSKTKDKDLFELPPVPKTEEDYFIETSSSEDETSTIMSQVDRIKDIHQIDVTGDSFKALPKDVQYEVLSEVRERRKENSWHKMHDMPKELHGFAGYQMERLLKRSQMQKTLENVGKELGDESAIAFDSSLFVGDREGLKKAKMESKKIASSRTDHYVLISGLKPSQDPAQVKDEPTLDEPGTSKEIRELKSDCDSDSIDDDPSAEVAKSMVTDDVPQEAIMRMIEEQEAKGRQVLDLSDDDDSVILQPSSQVPKSNRQGGNVASDNVIIPKEEEIESEVSKTVEIILRPPDQDEVGVMSDSGEDSDDLFADVFQTESDHSTLDKLLAEKGITKQKSPAPPSAAKSQEVIEAEDDLFADVFNPKPAKKVEPVKDVVQSIQEEAMRLGKKRDLYSQISKIAKGQPKKDEEKEKSPAIAETMKKSDHLWLKIASKWAEEEEEKRKDSGEKSAKNAAQKNTNLAKTNNPGKTLQQVDLLEEERLRLVREMKERELENKLLRLKEGTQEKPKADISSHGVVDKDLEEDNELFEKLGVQSMEKEKYDKQIAQKEGLADEDDGTVYGASVSGFVRSGKNKSVVEVVEHEESEIAPEIIEKLDDESEEAVLTEHELRTLQEKLAREQNALIAERAKQERMANSITDQMYADCQELLQLFGLPWIVSPGEAEAQCAFLDMNGLSHGSITDDSDVWVFGGQRVYKNFFSQDKHCELFTAAEVARHFGLSRERMILVAMLTGSDYTDGIETVGPVTALEVLAEFQGTGVEPLKMFRKWWDQFHKDLAMPPGSKVREKLRRLKIPSNFPNDKVVDAYLSPSVDNSTEKFSWSVPNFVAIRDFAQDKLGWTKGKIDEVLKPLIKQMNQKVSQGRIDNFFQSERLALPDKGYLQSSKRVQSAISKVLGKEPPKEPERKRKAATQSSGATKPKAAKSGPPPMKAPADLPPIPDRQQEAQRQREEAKRKAIEVLKKSKENKAAKLKKKFKRPQRIVLDTHNLSESDSD